MKRLQFLVVCIFSILNGWSQTPVGISYSNYAGISSVAWNPSIADSRYLVDINIFSLQLRNTSNVFPVNSGWARYNLFGFHDRYGYTALENSKNGYLHESYDIQMPGSFLLAFGKNRKNNIAAGFSWNTHSLFTAKNIDSDIASMLIFNQPLSADSMSVVKKDDASVNAMIWRDYGLTFSGVLLDEGNHFIKGGITGKLLSGIDALHFSFSSLKYKWLTSDSIQINSSAGNFFHSPGATLSDGYVPRPRGDTGRGYGIDLGLVYEFRRPRNNYQYEMDDSVYVNHQISKHLFSIGFSVIDIGKITLPSAPYSSSIGSSDFVVTANELSDIDATEDLDLIVAQKMNAKKNASNFKMKLPTTFNSFIDIDIYNGLGINVSYMFSPGFNKPQIAGVSRPSMLMITPKFENEKVGIFLPWRKDAFGQSSIGFTINTGPVFLGTSDIGNLMKSFKGKAETVDVMIGFKIPIRYKIQQDSDKDKISDRYDRCPSLFGISTASGCPDADRESIPDDIDNCPQIAGLRIFNGCPDTDLDGIMDSLDDCPLWAGPQENNGCPDKDKDGVWDFDDLCPEIAGSKETKGCPDSDNDGVFDHLDQCPNLKGEIFWEGCPDSDHDGIPNHKDDCPDEPGPEANGGCRFTDIDEDGVLDKDDLCPLQAGKPENKGCPVKIIYSSLKIYDIIYFENGTTINEANQKRMDIISGELIAILQKNPQYSVVLQGYSELADEVRDRFALSQQRAEIVRDYFVNKGLTVEKLKIEANGDNFPHEGKSPPEGQFPNRRVEVFLFLGDEIPRK
ncbi:MAG: OmpA family protein [Crocinitomicaceae bacterium]|nr:OmpA family protein [Crocinitomicaceae bacterium]